MDKQVDTHRVVQRMETPPTRWEPDEDEGYWGKSVLIFLIVAVLGGSAIWILNMLLDKIFGVGG